MKKLISTLMCLSVIGGTLPISAGAVSEPIYINDNPDSWTKTVYMGDVNDDEKIGVADLVALHRALLNNSGDTNGKYDVNYDGFVDAFDIAMMRHLVLNPNEAEKKTYSIDVLESGVSPEIVERQETLIIDFNQLNDYLSAVLTDSEEINKYLTRYNEEFFEENTLYLEPFTQKRGKGVFSVIEDDALLNENTILALQKFLYPEKEPVISEAIVGLIHAEYEYDMSLYPITETTMLAQITLPKSLVNSKKNTAVLNMDFLDDSHSGYGYTSPDGETELFVTQSSFLLGGDVDLYFRNPDGSFNHITDLATDDGCNPFSDEGEWFTDSEGNSAFGDRENYTITWKDGGFVVDHRVDGIWEKVSITGDGEVTDKSYYHNSYRKWREEDYEIGDYSHIYKSPDGKNTIRVTQFVDKNNDKVRLDFYFKGSDGSLQETGLDFSDYKCGDNEKLDNYRHVYPFDQNLTEWTKNEDGNDVISNISERTGSPTFRLTWKEDSVDVEFLESQSGRWDKKTIEFK